MGGKHKVANRTKNNAKPSSSGRSAAVLNSSLPQFGVFSALKPSAGLTHFTFSGAEDIDSSIDENFQLVLKKISKKDSTTKLKGLQEFSDLIKNSEPEVVKTLLPVWPRFYTVLATDVNNRVREATHIVHHEIVKKVKRNIAPYLKQIIAPWFTSQYDNYPPAASSAVQAFKDTFPPAKFQDAIIFCQVEILNYIYDNLLVQTVQTIAGQNSTPEEAQVKYERVILSCLQGYALYLQQVPAEQIKECAEENRRIVCNNTFWKLGKNKVALVRSAWFQVLSAMCQKAMFLLNNRETQVLTVVLNSLDDGEPTVLPHVWECVLLTVSSIQEWWRYINVDKLFMPKLVSVLKQGGQGNAVIIYPSLLPLVSHLSPVEGNALPFYSTIFENMRLGLKHKLVLNSRSETGAIATAFVECLQFIINKNVSDLHLCKSLLKYQLLALVEWSLDDATSCYKPIFNQISVFVQYLGEHSNAQTLLDFLFEHLQGLFRCLLLNALELGGDRVVDISKKQIELLHLLKQVRARKHKKYSKLTFDLDDDGAKGGGEKEKDGKPAQCKEKYLQELNKLAVAISRDYLDLIEKNHSKELLDELCSLIMDFDTKQFFECLMASMNHTSCMDLYDNLLKQWLESEKLYCKTVVKLIFVMLPFLDGPQRQAVLSNLLALDKPNSLCWALSEALSFPQVELPEVKTWLQEDKIGRFFLSIADMQIRNDDSPELTVIFKLALTENKDGDLYVSGVVLRQIIDKVRTALTDPMPLDLDACCALASYLCSIIYTDVLLLTYGEELLLSLLKMSCVFRSANDFISSETLQEMNSAWQDSLGLLLSGLSERERTDLARQVIGIVEKHFLQIDIKNKEEVDHLAGVALEFLRTGHRSVPSAMPEMIRAFYDIPILTASSDATITLCKVAEYVTGSLSSRTEELKVDGAINESDIVRHFVWSYIKFHLLCSPLTSDENDDDEDTEDVTDNLFLFVTNRPEEAFLDAFHDYVVGESFLTHFTNVKFYNEIVLYNTLLEDGLRAAVCVLDEVQLASIEALLKERSVELGWFWAKALPVFYRKGFKEKDAVRTCLAWIKEFKGQDISGIQHLSDIFRNDIQTENEQDPAVIFEELRAMQRENMTEFQYTYPRDMTWDRVQAVIRAVRLCTTVAAQENPSPDLWDIVALSLVSWASNCYKARNVLNSVRGENHRSFQHQTMLVAVSELYTTICSQKAESDKSYAYEWKDVLFESVHAEIALMWLYLAEQLSEGPVALCNLPMIRSFGKVTEYLNSRFIFGVNDALPKWTKFFKTSCCLLTNSSAVVQLWGYRMLLKCVPGLIDIDTEAISSNTLHKKGLIFEQFKAKFGHVEEVVNGVLSEFKVGESTCRVEPSYDSFTYTFAYLLLWDVMLTLYQSAAPELRYQYSEWLKNDNLVQSLLPNLLRLMPLDVLHYSEGKSKSLTGYFTTQPLDRACYEYSCDSDTIEQLACYLYKSSLSHLPALVRQWWSNLDTRMSQIVDKITTVYVSPILCAEELSNVSNHQTKFKNMTIKVMPSIREILAVYTIDEAQMELTIALPANYPLGGPDIHCNRQISGTTHKQWLLQFKKCVLHQNGRIWDGLSLWNNNLDRKFDGVEECYICYAVLHPGSYQLPKLCCRTCKKKFHSVCLYKWFSTSNKSSCPICRNLF